MNTTKYWIAAISKEHAQSGVNGNFIQVCHGKQTPLKQMKKGDYLIIYSSKITMEGNEKLQAFTAVGQVADDEIYQFQMTENFKPFRRNIEFLKSVECLIAPLINDLEFILNKKKWGYPFRFGFLEIKENDFHLITSKMLQHEPIGQHI
ncbi:EVE domain-containing protein [Pedobacter sp. MR22-3]|uniref:EVE domain-containing protein n=1 Tax=Pedobacter sp. MR22-3 TaxID=2994552 RepID=UPI002246CC46|nr:EVE domain-containing protein [Pedobacter sp. MR22-3]MCX2585247.1 EVE domain-containing protein [Pedobacter sp. MR22-3]